MTSRILFIEILELAVAYDVAAPIGKTFGTAFGGCQYDDTISSQSALSPPRS
jgi:hypothetical protein